MRNAQTLLLLFLLAAASLPLLSASLLEASLHDLQTAGQVVVHAPSGQHVWTSSTAWVDLPGMKGAVTLPKGGDLMVSLTVEGEVTGGSSPVLYVRALVDGNALSPTVIKLFAGASGTRTTSSTFFAAGLLAGPHQVNLQWSVGAGATAHGYGRSLVLRFATPDSPHLRLAGAEGQSLTRQGGGWLDLPGMTATVDCPWDARVGIHVSGEFLALAATRRVFIRAVVDGHTVASPSDTIVAEGVSSGTRAFTFIVPKLARGRHTVQIQWASDDYAMVLFPTLTLTALPDAINCLTGWLQQAAPSGVSKVNSSASYVPVPDLGGLVFVPARCDLAVRVAAEAGTGPGASFYLRVLVDGQPTNDQSYVLAADTGTLQQAREGVFVVRNVERGWHNVEVLWAASMGGTVYLGDRTLIVTAVVGQRPLLVTATESTRPTGYPYGGQFGSGVVAMVGGKRTFRAYVADNFYRADPGVADWFAENSGGHLFVVEAAVIGPNLKKYDEKYYRENIPDPFTEMKLEALRFADQVFDFSYYDRDGDGKVTRHELYAICVFYQDSIFGEVRPIPALVTNDGVTLDYSGWIATAYVPDFKLPAELGVLDHELSHLLLDAGDMYETNDPTAPGPYSIMDDARYNSHLDPLHKLVQGRWYEAAGITADGYCVIKPIELGGNLLKLYDPQSHKGEYFLVENRQRVGYDCHLPSDGLAVWHCDESRLPNWRTAVEIEPAGGPTLRYPDYLFRGVMPGFHLDNDLWQGSPRTDTRWHDLTASGIGVWAIQRVDDQGNIRAFLDVPGPGVLCQVEQLAMPIDPFRRQSIRIRLVNTHTAADQFKVTVSVKGWASWTTTYVPLQGYEQRILELQVMPDMPAGFSVPVTVQAQSTTSSAIQCTDTCTLHYTLITDGAGFPGGTVKLDCHYPGENSRFYEMRASLGSAPGFVVPGVGTIPLHADSLFFATPYLSHIFQKFQNRLDAGGWGCSYVAIPNDGRLRGVNFHCAYVTYDTVLHAVSNGVMIAIQ
ncbi:MAG: hypothetical protein JXQ29_06045 [Planctomycetes bacterium]|nr:hypothetical protein [Planctomycetota bacterium]